MLGGNTWFSVYLTRHEPGIFRIEVRVDLLGYLLIVHVVGKRIFTNRRQRRKERNKGNKELNNGREKRQATPTIKEFSYDSAALHKHWNETRSHEIKYVTSDLFHR